MNPPILDACYDLLEQLAVQDAGDSPLTELARQFGPLVASLAADQRPTVIEELCQAAEQQRWYAPRRSRALAQLAWLIAGQGAPPASLARSQLTLGVVFNVLGQFSAAMPLLGEAQTFFETRPDQIHHTARCYSETGLACLFLGRFPETQAALACARQLAVHSQDQVQLARCEQTWGLMHLAQNQYQAAVAHFEEARQLFTRGHHLAEAALSGLFLADTWLYMAPDTAQHWLEQARTAPALTGSAVHQARCDLVQGFIYVRLNRYEDSLIVYRRAWAIFAQEAMGFLAARCDVDRGIAHYRLNQYDAALRVYDRARTAFLALGLSSQVDACDLNIANVYYDLNRCDEALPIYQRVAQAAETEGRLLRAGRCYNNMGACYQKLGRYDRALDLHKRAEQLFRAGDDLFMAAIALESLASAYRDLGRYNRALATYRAAQQIFERNDLALHLAFCDMQIAVLHLALNQPELAQQRLLQARQLYQAKGMTAYQAICSRRLARVAYALQDDASADWLLTEAQQFFTALKMPVEVALCQLLAGKVKLRIQDEAAARAAFQAAYAVLAQGFSDQASLALEGLAACAAQREEWRTALEYYVSAAKLVTHTRSLLTTERVRGDFFRPRQHIFQEAIKLALRLDDPQQALALTLDSKAQNLFTLQNLWYLHRGQSDPYVSPLLDRAAMLRRQFAAQRPNLQSSENQAPHNPALFEQLTELGRAYEDTIEQLRLALPAQAGAIVPFNLTGLRHLANHRFGERWCCLEYFINDADLIIFYLDSRRLQTYTRRLAEADRWLLSQCTHSAADRRQLVYQGQIRGFPVPGNPGKTYLRRLSQLLLPPEILSQSAWDMLMIAPHQRLHNLPFHALLLENETALLEKGPIAYIPSLHLLFHLWQQQLAASENSAVLLCGVESFGSRAASLPYAKHELLTVAGLTTNSRALFQEEASRTRLNRLNLDGQLARYATVHLATHAITEPAAPMLSRILLADDDLTVADILGLKLSARLIVLSTCTSAIGELAPGDEMMTLARAFFHAGAQTVVSSLWAVEDKTTVTLMENFYRAYQAGAGPAQALRQAQLRLKNSDLSPYHWAPFIAIGCP